MNHERVESLGFSSKNFLHSVNYYVYVDVENSTETKTLGLRI